MSSESAVRKSSMRFQFLVLALGLAGAFFAVVMFELGFVDRTVIEKVLTDAVMPMELISTALLIITIDAYRRGRTVQWKLLAIICGILFVGGNGMVANAFIGTLEGRYHRIDPLAGPAFDQVILLGGGTAETAMGNVQVNKNGDRVVMAARLFHHGLVHKIYCSGAKTESIAKFARNGSEHAKQLLLVLGVPNEAIEEIGGRNTAAAAGVVSAAHPCQLHCRMRKQLN